MTLLTQYCDINPLTNLRITAILSHRHIRQYTTSSGALGHLKNSMPLLDSCPLCCYVPKECFIISVLAALTQAQHLPVK